jgi:hypothetical protein
MLLFLARLLQVLAALLLVRLVARALAGFFRPRRAPAMPRTEPPSQVAASELVRDRVCNTFLPRDRALSATVGGQLEYFCSAACRDRALSAAERTA